MRRERGRAREGVLEEGDMAGGREGGREMGVEKEKRFAAWHVYLADHCHETTLWKRVRFIVCFNFISSSPPSFLIFLMALGIKQKNMNMCNEMLPFDEVACLAVGSWHLQIRNRNRRLWVTKCTPSEYIFRPRSAF